MKSSARSQFKVVLRQVNDILRSDWAPVGFADDVPLDEYESYALQVISVLASGATADDLAAYLVKAEEDIRGASVGKAALGPLAARLMEFQEAACAIAL